MTPELTDEQWEAFSAAKPLSPETSMKDVFLTGAAWGAAARQRFDVASLREMGAAMSRPETRNVCNNCANFLESQQMPEAK